MFYDYYISTPKSTPELSKLSTRLKLAKGTIVQVSILFPPGSIGLLFLQVFRGLHQLFPFNPGGYFRTSGESINFIDSYDLLVEPFELVAQTWNLDDTYDHGIHLRINIKPFDPILEVQKKENLLKLLLKRLGL